MTDEPQMTLTGIEPMDTDNSRYENTQRNWSIDPYFSGPEAGDNPERHHGLDEFDRIKTPSEKATFDPRKEVSH